MRWPNGPPSGRAKNLGPTLVEYVTYRVGAHSSSDDPSAYRPKAESDAWPLGDPIVRLKNHLIQRGVWSDERHTQAEAEILETVIAAQREAERHGTLHAGGKPSTRDMFEGVYARDAAASQTPAPAGGGLTMPRRTMIEAIRDAMDVSMGRDERVIVFGEDVGFFGGVFRCTQGLQAKYGKSRCFDTPISEAGIVGSAIGMAAYGLKPCVEVQFADYVYPAYDQIVSEAARLRYRSNGDFTCPIVVRMPTGGGIFGGQTHSQSPEALFTHVSGLKVVVPSNPHDAKGLLIAAIEDPDPVIFLEPKRLYNGPFDGHHERPVTPWSKHELGEVADGHYTVPLGKAVIRRPGAAVTVLAYGTMVYVAQAAAEETGIDAEIIDLRTLLPLDLETIVDSVNRTGRCVIVHEATLTSGFGAELSALVQENCFYHLEAPVVRVAGWDTPYPHAQEWDYFPGPARLGRALVETMEA